MNRKLPVRFWFEALSGAIGLILFILTLFSGEWIEELTGWEPDGGNDSLEIALAVGLLAISAISMLAARRDYLRAASRA